jgi:hypothetical protein
MKIASEFFFARTKFGDFVPKNCCQTTLSDLFLLDMKHLKSLSKLSPTQVIS